MRIRSRLLNGELAVRLKIHHYVKSVCIWSSSGPYFPAFGLNYGEMPYLSVFSPNAEKLRTRITPNTDTLHAIHRSRVSKILRNWVPMLSNVLSYLIMWPKEGTIKTNLPA